MRPALICLALILTGCAALDNAGSNDRVISETGGEVVKLANGVCVVTRTDNDEDFTFIAPSARCQE